VKNPIEISIFMKKSKNTMIPTLDVQARILFAS